jgi:4-nitrophenyl phosphatase
VLRDRVGIEADPRSIVTSGMAAASFLVVNGLESAFVIGSLELVDTLRTAGIAVTGAENADAVVVGFDSRLTQDKIEMASRAVRQGAAFVATNTDATFPTPQGEVPGTGVIVAAIGEASGRAHVTCGKPERPMYELIRERVRADRIIMVGDRPETDIAFALASGWESVLTLSGVTASPSDVPEQLTPDRVVTSIADLNGILGPILRHTTR